METISGINSVTRGQPEASLKSGNALALVQSMAIQFISGLQQSYVKLIEQVGTQLINNLKDYAKAPRVAAIVGKNNRTELKEFIGDDLQAINRVVVDMGNALSRCLAKDTPVLMFDGSIKMVQDIKVGEKLMGPDSKPRTVESTASGEEEMYKVKSYDKYRNIEYGCNESHILSLKYCSDDYRYDAKKGDILDISIRDYNKLPERHKNILQGFTTGVEFKSKELPIPAYILGTWLGDGTSAATAITSMDKEIVDEWQNYALSLSLSFRESTSKSNGKAKTYFITSGQSHGKSDRNPFMNDLRELELINNKHIPQFYKTASRKDRLELLAGLIDTDGHRSGETFFFTQKSDRLANDVVYLAKSLGFRVTTKKRVQVPSKLVKTESVVNRITIGGNTWEIPTRCPRKQCVPVEKQKDWLNYGIVVESVGPGTYYGFTLKEEPHFMLGDFTVTHNTTAGRVQMAEQLLQMNLVKTPQEYFEVLNTGKLDTVFENDLHQTLLIKQENEKMMQGNTPLVAPTDLHSIHIKEHSSVLSDSDIRENPDLIKVVNDHMQAHINALVNTDPRLLQIIGEHPLPPLQPPQQPGQPPVPGAPSGPGGPGPGPQQGPPPQQPAPKAAPNGGKPMTAVLQPQTGLIKPGQNIGGQTVPAPAKPPKPFNSLPTNPGDNLPNLPK
jgi:hypothetical protein